MKRIRLTDEAHGRLMEWCAATQSSASEAILSLLPRRGTLGDLLRQTALLPSLSLEQAVIMDESSAWGAGTHGDRTGWTC